MLENYSYPGNVRELKNILLDICVRNTSGFIAMNDLPPHLPRPVFKPEEVSQLNDHPLSALVGKFPTLEELEIYTIKEVMRITGNNQSATARILKMARPTLNKRLKTIDV